LQDEEKLALVDFAVKEFDLTRCLAWGCPRVAASSRLGLHHMSRSDSKVDLVFWDAGLNGIDEPSAVECLTSLSRKAVVCVDGQLVATPSNELLYQTMAPILETPEFSLFARRDGDRPLPSMRYQMDLCRRRYAVDTARRLRREHPARMPLVAVIVLTYEHERYIAQCLGSVLTQKGPFRMRVIIVDDASTDRTAEVASAVLADLEDDRNAVELRVNPENVGVVRNLAATVSAAAGCDYFTFCEGDDFWSSEARIAEHIAFLESHPDCVMSFNTLERCSADGGSREVYAEQAQLVDETIDGASLAAFNVIGNFSACFYDGALLEAIPTELFDLYAVDWFFNLYCAQFGALGHLKSPLSVYRQHERGEWSGRPEGERVAELWRHIAEYNAFLDFQYDHGFQAYKRQLLQVMRDDPPDGEGLFDLIVVDDIFPSRHSGFRLAEFTAYLSELPKSMVLTSGRSLFVLEDATLDDVVRRFKREHPELGDRIMTSDGTFPLELGKLLYVDFLNNARALLPAAEATGVPFAFTLYPGGGFVRDDPETDRVLRRIFRSPCFRKVFVTQDVTYDYVVDGGLCPKDRVEMVFGVVMPQDAFAHADTRHKPRWGLGKRRLDVCFMAHRYTARGEDKGYDVFVELAKRLCERHGEIFFHVVGPYDPRVIEIGAAADRMRFPGTLDPEDFDAFFLGMDIIVSPNVSGLISPGAFDGFPTASCIEAGVRGVAMFATDEFGSGTGRFTDGRDIVLIEHEVAQVTDKVEQYYADPSALKSVGERGRARILDLYSARAQIGPRVAVLRGLLAPPAERERTAATGHEHSWSAQGGTLGDLLLAPDDAQAGGPPPIADARRANEMLGVAHRELEAVRAELARLNSRFSARAGRALRHPRATLSKLRTRQR